MRNDAAGQDVVVEIDFEPVAFFVPGVIYQVKQIVGIHKAGVAAHFVGQVALANDVFTPSEAAVTEAREILAAMEAAKERGEGATVYKGRLVDIASIKQAEVIVRQSEMISG